MECGLHEGIPQSSRTRIPVAFDASLRSGKLSRLAWKFWGDGPR